MTGRTYVVTLVNPPSDLVERVSKLHAAAIANQQNETTAEVDVPAVVVDKATEDLVDVGDQSQSVAS